MRWVFLCVSGLLAYLSFQGGPLLRSWFSQDDPAVRACAGGLAISVVLWFALVRRWRFWSTFEHELTHTLVALLLFRRPREFVVNADGSGHAVYQGRPSVLITLAPYFLPTFNLLLLPFDAIIRPEWHLWYMGLFGFLLGYHMLSALSEAHPNQPDLTAYGRVFSYLFVGSASLFIYALLLAFILRGFDGMAAFLWDVVQNGRALLTVLQAWQGK